MRVSTTTRIQRGTGNRKSPDKEMDTRSGQPTSWASLCPLTMLSSMPSCLTRPRRRARRSWPKKVRLKYGRGSAHVDYKPVPDLTKWPRANVHLPTGDENPLRAWAWRADIGGGGRESLLQGKSVVFKDTVCVAGVPLVFGTDAFEGYIRESPSDTR